eukprot:SAG11_NODE_3996_length_2115_cov_1.402282_2_plen_252_part_01
MAQAYASIWERHGSDFEVVFISRDRSQPEFAAYAAAMPWLAMPWHAPRDSVAARFGVRGIPALVLLDGHTGAVLRDGRSGLQLVGNDQQTGWAGFPWGVLVDAPPSSPPDRSVAQLEAAARPALELQLRLRPRAATAAEQHALSSFMQRVQANAEAVYQYEDPMAQAVAVSLVPVQELEMQAGGGAANVAGSVSFFRELLKWFKFQFFKWTDTPPYVSATHLKRLWVFIQITDRRLVAPTFGQIVFTDIVIF